MTPKQADKIIKASAPVQFTERGFTQVHTLRFISRDRWLIRGEHGESFERADLTIVFNSNLPINGRIQ